MSWLAGRVVSARTGRTGESGSRVAAQAGQNSRRPPIPKVVSAWLFATSTLLMTQPQPAYVALAFCGRSNTFPDQRRKQHSSLPDQSLGLKIEVDPVCLQRSG